MAGPNELNFLEGLGNILPGTSPIIYFAGKAKRLDWFGGKIWAREKRDRGDDVDVM